MNWEAAGAMGEIVGAVAVILTLFYLARQVKHAADQSRLNGVQAIQAANDRAFDPIYSTEVMSIWHRGHQDREALTPADRQIFDLLMVRIMASYASSYFQHENGGYDDELMDGLTDFVGSLLASPGGSSWYRSGQITFSRGVRSRLAAVMTTPS